MESGIDHDAMRRLHAANHATPRWRKMKEVFLGLIMLTLLAIVFYMATSISQGLPW